jgi:hypothetical protein
VAGIAVRDARCAGGGSSNTVAPRNLGTIQVALAVIALAHKLGIPVIGDTPLACRVYFGSKRYAFVPLSALDGVLRTLYWLADVARAGRPDGPDVRPDDEWLLAAVTKKWKSPAHGCATLTPPRAPRLPKD